MQGLGLRIGYTTSTMENGKDTTIWEFRVYRVLYGFIPVSLSISCLFMLFASV